MKNAHKSCLSIEKYPIEDLIDACREYVEQTNRRISFEWALIGENDTEEEAHRLAELLQGLLCHVNVIPLNPTHGLKESLPIPKSPSDLSAF